MLAPPEIQRRRPDIIPRAAAEYLLGSNRSNFERFAERHQLRPLHIVGAGSVYRRSEFIAAVEPYSGPTNSGARMSIGGVMDYDLLAQIQRPRDLATLQRVVRRSAT